MEVKVKPGPTCFVILEVPFTVTFTVKEELEDKWEWMSNFSDGHETSDISAEIAYFPPCSIQDISKAEASCESDAFHLGLTENNTLQEEDEWEYNTCLDINEICNRTVSLETTDQMFSRCHTPGQCLKDHDMIHVFNKLKTDKENEHSSHIITSKFPANGQDLPIACLTKLSVDSSSESLQQFTICSSQAGKFMEELPVEQSSQTENSIFTRKLIHGLERGLQYDTTPEELHVTASEAKMKGFIKDSTSDVAELMHTFDLSHTGLSYKWKDDFKNIFPQTSIPSSLTLIITSSTSVQKELVPKPGNCFPDSQGFIHRGNEGNKNHIFTGESVIIEHLTDQEDKSHQDFHSGESEKLDLRNIVVRSGILKHSTASALTDSQQEHLWTSVKKKWMESDNLFLKKKVPSKAVTFHHEIELFSNQNLNISARSGMFEAVERLRTVVGQLHLPVNHCYGTKEKCSLSVANMQWNFKENIADKASAGESGKKLFLIDQDINKVIINIKQDLLQIKKTDEIIACQLLNLYSDMKRYKYMCNCQLYREMMETAIDNEDKKDELSCHHVDAIPERLCSTLKQWGLTRSNLQRRRFSIF